MTPYNLNKDQTFNTTHASQVSLSQALGNTTDRGEKEAKSSMVGNTAEYLRRREEMETQEVRRHKKDFISFCSDALTQHKMENMGNALPDSKEKHKVLQRVIDDPATLLREEGREPTVPEYGKFINGMIREEANVTPSTNGS